MKTPDDAHIDLLRRLPPQRLRELLSTLSDEEAACLYYHWPLWARPSQRVPPGEDWKTWLILTGRGWGKTRTGAETVRHWVESGIAGRIALIAPSAADARDVMVEGESGILAVSPPWFYPTFTASKRRLTWPNGAIATIYSAEDPDQLRGPQHDGGFCDELCAWAYPETWDLYQFGLRLGRNPRTIVTTTPKPVKLLRDLVNDPTTKVTVGSSYENRDNLAPTFFHKIVSQYEGTRLGRQELHAEIINLEEEGIIQRSWFKLYSATKALPEFNYIIMSLDTAFSDDNLPDGRRKKETDPTARTVWGLFKPLNRPYCVMLLDAWAERLAYPDLWRRIPEEFRFSYGDPPHRPDVALIEAKGSGISLRQDLQRAGLPCRPYNPGHDDKVMRLHAVSHIVYHGRVYIPESKSRPGQFASWAEPFVSQVCTFPNDEHDDYVDCLSQILALVRDEGYIDFDTPPEEETDYYEPTPPTERRNPYATVK